jgi:beta-lactamase regulating signal transducer with metallopeptidase domain
MSLLNQVVSPALLRAVGLALLHSLWQGMVLALVVAGLLHLLRQRAAVVRYRLAALALATLVGLGASTFAYYYHSAVPEATVPTQLAPAVVAAAIAQAKAPYPSPLVLSAPTWPGAAQGYLEQQLPLLVAAWLLGLVLRTVRLGLALRYVRRLRQHRLVAVPEAWQQCLGRLARRAGLARPVQLLASGLVPSPLVMGYVKPVILLPISLLTNMAPAELEMILAHELAHVLRKDYLFNFVQSVVETVFFYHPAVWYLSGVLHTERENCCDDLATQLTGSPQQLARALAALAELTYFPEAAPRLALAAAGPAGSLLSRVRRLAGYRSAQATGLWPASSVLLGVGLLLGGALLSAKERGLHVPVTTTRHRHASTTKHTPDEAPRLSQAPLAKSDDELQALFQRQLVADGLLPDADHYTCALTQAGLTVNGRPQPGADLGKYQRLYEAATGYRWLAATTYRTENTVTYDVALTPPQATSAAEPATTPAQAALRQQLQRDGLVPTDARQFRLAVTKTGAFLVNGQPQPAQLLATYRPWLHVPAARAGRLTAVELVVR